MGSLGDACWMKEPVSLLLFATLPSSVGMGEESRWC